MAMPWLDETHQPIPVVLDTDIGDDIDDTWALAMLLNSPELELKLVTTAYGNTSYRAKIVAKLLEIAGRTDVPVGLGLPQGQEEGAQAPWVADYALARYPGRVCEDGVEALIEVVLSSPQPVTIISIGPLPNISAALTCEPRIAERARFVGMHGSIFREYAGKAGSCAEWNVVADIPASKQVFSANWPMTITPLDTCGRVVLRGEKYRAVLDCSSPLTRAVIDNYRIWSQAHGYIERAEVESSTLFDTVAVYLAFAQGLCEMRDLGVSVTDAGYTCVDDTAKRLQVALEWRDLAAFEDLVVARITGAHR